MALKDGAGKTTAESHVVQPMPCPFCGSTQVSVVGESAALWFVQRSQSLRIDV